MSFEPEDDQDQDDEGGEFEVNIDPIEEELEKRGIEQAEFEEALYAALEAHGESLEATGEDGVTSTLEDLALKIKGQAYRLGDLADVTIDEPFDDDEEEEEDIEDD